MFETTNQRKASRPNSSREIKHIFSDRFAAQTAVCWTKFAVSPYTACWKIHHLSIMLPLKCPLSLWIYQLAVVPSTIVPSMFHYNMGPATIAVGFLNQEIILGSTRMIHRHLQLHLHIHII